MMNPEGTAVPKPSIRWFHPTPGRLLALLLAVDGILYLYDWFRWTPKGWAVLMAVAAVGVFLIGMLLWFVLAVCFRCRFQFTIRSMLLLTVALAIPFSWLAVEVKNAKEQREAVEALIKLGGRVSYEYQTYLSDLPDLSSHLQYQSKTPPGPRWLRHFLGDDFFTDVSFVFFVGFRPYITDSDLEYLKRLSQLREVSFEGSIHVTDAGMECFSELSQLEALDMTETEITDAGLKQIEGLKQLQWLRLENTQVTDVGLAHIKGLNQLEMLNLKTTKVTDAGVKKLQQALPNCKIEY